MYALSVEQNLNRILTTKKYTLPLLNDLGMSKELTDSMFSPEELLSFKEEILSQILKYEPRVSINDIQTSFKEGALILEIYTEDKTIQVTLR